MAYLLARALASGLLYKSRCRYNKSRGRKVMKSNRKFQLSGRQLQVIPHILASPSYEEAARRAKITSKQIYEWLQDPQFKVELSRRRSETYNEALSSLKTATTRAVQTLTTLLSDEDPRVRLNAADKILVHTLKGIEYLGFEERLTDIESRVDRALKVGDKQ